MFCGGYIYCFPLSPHSAGSRTQAVMCAQQMLHNRAGSTAVMPNMLSFFLQNFIYLFAIVCV